MGIILSGVYNSGVVRVCPLLLKILDVVMLCYAVYGGNAEVKFYRTAAEFLDMTVPHKGAAALSSPLCRY